MKCVKCNLIYDGDWLDDCPNCGGQPEDEYDLESGDMIEMTTHKPIQDLESAAHESEHNRDYGNSYDERIDAFKSGAAWQLAWVLERLRSMSVSEAGGNPEAFEFAADWLKKKARGE